MSVHKLKNAPLKEVIFEIFWQGKQNPEGGYLEDEGYDLAVGKFHERISSKFPVKKQKIDPNGPIRTFGIPVYQYWTGEMKWPVVQHGPGTLAINDVEENYEWENHFKPLIEENIKKLCESYEKVPTFNRLKLQYIDAFDLEHVGAHEFLGKQLQTNFSFKFETPGEEISLGLYKQYRLNDESIMTVNIQTAENNRNNKPAILLTMYVERQKEISANDIMRWADFAHKNTSLFFKKMLEPSYYAALDK